MSPAAPPPLEPLPPVRQVSAFATTRWTLVLAAREGDQAPEALEQLCRLYWFPLFAYIRRRGHDAHQAQDLTQGFFESLLERRALDRVRREGGRFRSFLLTVLNHYLANEHERTQARKRGRGVVFVPWEDGEAEERYQREPRPTDAPDQLFDRRWALALMEDAIGRLATESAALGKGAVFQALRPFLSREPDPGEYGRLATELGLAPGTLAVQVHRLRERFRLQVRAAVADTVESPVEVEAEMRHLLTVLGAG